MNKKGILMNGSESRDKKYRLTAASRPSRLLMSLLAVFALLAATAVNPAGAQDSTESTPEESNPDRDPSRDLLNLDDDGRQSPILHGIWSDGSTVWVSDGHIADKIFAYDFDSGERIADKDNDGLRVDWHRNVRDMWSDGTIMWVAIDDSRDWLFAYELESGQRRNERDIDLKDPYDGVSSAEWAAYRNGKPRGLWGDGTTLWVSDHNGVIFAYDLETGAFSDERSFSTGFGLKDWVRGIWSDGLTMWLLEGKTKQILAYELATGRRQPHYDIDADVEAFSHYNYDGEFGPAGLWSDGTTMWVPIGKFSSNKGIYAFHMPERPALKSLGLSDAGMSPRFSTETTSYESGTVPTWLDSVTVTAEATSLTVSGDAPSGIVSIEPADADPDEDGHQVDLSPGANTITVTVTAAGGTAKVYSIEVERDHPETFDRVPEHDVEFSPELVQSHGGNISPGGLWSDGTTMWVGDYHSNSVFAVNPKTGEHEPARDIGVSYTIWSSDGLWSDGTTMWISDPSNPNERRLAAHNLESGDHEPEHDIELPVENGRPSGLWSDGTTIWVANSSSQRIFAYDLATGVLDDTLGFETASGNRNPSGLWSNGTTMWVTDDYDKTTVYAYALESGAALTNFWFHPDGDGADTTKRSLWSDGDFMWLGEFAEPEGDDFSGTGSLKAYKMPPSAALESLEIGVVVDGGSGSGSSTKSSTAATPAESQIEYIDFGTFAPFTPNYRATVNNRVSNVFVSATSEESDATVQIEPGSGTGNRHQVNLDVGENEITILVHSADGSNWQTYTVTIHRNPVGGL